MKQLRQKPDTLEALKGLIRTEQPSSSAVSGPASGEALLKLGIHEIDHLLQGGLCCNAVHEVRCDHARDAGAASGFVLGLLSALRPLIDKSKPAAKIVWILVPPTSLETGILCPDGISQYGVDPAKIILVQPQTLKQALWVAGEAARCAPLAALVLQLSGNPAALDQSVLRRLTLRARESGVFVCILRHSGEQEGGMSATRWRVEAWPSVTNQEFKTGVGEVRHVLTLEKSATGRTGKWPVAWDPQTRKFRHAADRSQIPHSPSRLSPPAARPGRSKEMGQVVALG